MTPNETSKANREAAAWLVFVVVSAVCGAGIAALLILAFQMPAAWAALSATPIAVFLGSMFALVAPLRRATIAIGDEIFPWLPFWR